MTDSNELPAATASATTDKSVCWRGAGTGPELAEVKHSAMYVDTVVNVRWSRAFRLGCGSLDRQQTAPTTPPGP